MSFKRNPETTKQSHHSLDFEIKNPVDQRHCYQSEKARQALDLCTNSSYSEPERTLQISEKNDRQPKNEQKIQIGAL